MLLKFYEIVLQRIRDQKDQYTLRISQGPIHNFEDYREMSGKIFGLKQAEEIVKDVFDDIQMPAKQITIDG